MLKIFRVARRPIAWNRFQMRFFAVFFLFTGFFVFAPFASAVTTELPPEATQYLEGLPADHLQKVLEATLKPDGPGPADASKFKGTVIIGGASAADGAIQIGRAANTANSSDLVKSDISKHAIILSVPSYIEDGYFPGIVWRVENTKMNIAKKPWMGIWGQMTQNGSKLYLGTSNNPTRGITNQALTIIQNGNVGIGTATPSATLDVQGGAQFGTKNVNLINSSGKISDISSTYFTSVSGSNLTELNASNLSSGTVPSMRVSGEYDKIDGVGTLKKGTWNAVPIITAFTVAKDTTDDSWLGVNPVVTTGNVGIGTATPSDKLTIVDGAIRIDGKAGQGWKGRIGSWGGLEFYPDTDNSGDDDITFYNNNRAPVLSIAITNRVGIRTAYPSTDLEVRGAGRITGNALYFYGSGNAADGLSNARLTESWGMRYNSPSTRHVFSSDNSIVVGYQPNGQDWSKRGIYVSDFVNIGTIDMSTPGALLTVARTNDNVQTKFEILPAVKGMDLNQNGWVTLNVGGNNKNLLVNDNFIVNGNVGIGTENPGAKLTTRGRISIEDEIIPVGSEDLKYHGKLVITNHEGRYQYINLIRRENYPWSIGIIPNAGSGYTSVFGIGPGSVTDSGFSPYFAITTGGKVGIGTTTPCSGCALDVRRGDINVGYLGNDRFVNLPQKEKLAYETDRVGLDIAELFESKEEVEVGDIVAVSDTARKLKKSGTAYDEKIVGVVSGAPAILFEGSELKMGANPNRFEKGTKPPVTLAGRVPVKVSLENGPIKPGDYITSSSKPGIAMKATEPGMTIGVALESYDGAGESLVLVFLNLDGRNIGSAIMELQERLKKLERKIRW